MKRFYGILFRVSKCLWIIQNLPLLFLLRYHHTGSSTLFYGLREALAIVCEEGLPRVIQRHRECSSELQRGMEAMGLEMFVPELKNRMTTVNTVKVPPGVDWKKVSKYAMDKYLLEVRKDVVR